MGKRTLAIKHTLEKNLFYKFCLTGLEIKNHFGYDTLTERTLTQSAIQKVGEDENFSFFMCKKPTYDNRLRKKDIFYNQTFNTKLRLLRLVETSASRLQRIKIYRRKKISKM